MARHRRYLALTLALALVGCPATNHAAVKPHASLASIGPDAVSNLISEHGSGLIANNGGGLVGKVKCPAGIVANNAGSLVSDGGGGVIANNAGNIISNHAGGYRLQAIDESPMSGFTVAIVDAAGKAINDASGKPYQTVTGKDGSYAFASTPRGANLVVRVSLPSGVGDMVAYLPDAAEGAKRESDVDGTSTLVMGYVLDKFLAGQADPQTTLQKLPGDVEATTRAKAQAALSDASGFTSFQPTAVTTQVEALEASHADFKAQVEVVRQLLFAGLSNVGDGQAASAVALSVPKSLALMADGSLLIAERDGHRVRRLDVKTGTISTLAGKDGATTAGDGGPATAAFIDRPVYVAAAPNGDVFIADFGHCTIRRVDAKTQVITSVAGNGERGDGVDGHTLDGKPATSMALSHPAALAAGADNLPVFISGDGAFRVLADGKLQLLSVPGFDQPDCLTTGPDGKIYGFAYTSGQVMVLDGTAFKVVDVPVNPAATDSRMAIAKDGSYYLATDDQVMVLSPGATAWKQVPIGSSHGTFNFVLAGADKLFLSDGELNRIWSLPFAGGSTTSVAGLEASTADAIDAANLSLNRPGALALNGPGHLLVADGLNGIVWERRPDGLFYRFAGGALARSGDKDIGDGGPARDAKLLKVVSLVRLHDGTVLIGEADAPDPHATPSPLPSADQSGGIHTDDAVLARVREIGTDGTITTRPMPDGLFAPAIMKEAADGGVYCSDYLFKKVFHWLGTDLTPAVNTDQVKQPGDIAVAPDGSFYVTDVDTEAIWHVVNGQPTLIAGVNGAGFSGDGGPATSAQLSTPLGLALAANGDLYLSDTRNDRVRRIRHDNHVIETIAGQGGVAFTGSSPDDSLKEPVGLVIDNLGDLYVSDSGHNQVKRVEAAKLAY